MKTLSARQLALVAGVSESSIKRWSDQGEIHSLKTVGGHRRIPLNVAVEFLRHHDKDIASLGALGLPLQSKTKIAISPNLVDEFYRAIVAGNEELCRQIIFQLHLSGERVARICDELIAPVFHRVGERWKCSEVEVYQERRGCDLCLRIIHELRAIIPLTKKKAPVAIGTTYCSDNYTIPNSMAEIVLRQSGWRAESIGAQLPFATIVKAIETIRPRLFWLCVSTIADEQQFVAEYRKFYEQVRNRTAVVVGGRALHESLRRGIEYSSYCDNMQHLEAFANALRKA